MRPTIRVLFVCIVRHPELRGSTRFASKHGRISFGIDGGRVDNLRGEDNVFDFISFDKRVIFDGVYKSESAWRLSTRILA